MTACDICNHILVSMLPETLLLLLNAALALAQSPRPQLSLNTLSTFNATTLPNPPSFTLPVSLQLSVSVALCSTGSSSPRVFLTNSSTNESPGPEGGTDVYEIAMDDGYGAFTGVFAAGGVLSFQDVGLNTLEIGVSDTGTYVTPNARHTLMRFTQGRYTSSSIPHRCWVILQGIKSSYSRLHFHSLKFHSLHTLITLYPLRISLHPQPRLRPQISRSSYRPRRPSSHL